MKNENAFTLIELLAIIVILAIIAVITVPIILSIVDESKQKSSIASAYGYKDAVEKDYVKKLLTSNEQKLNGTYAISNGKLNNQDISISGTVPTNGSLVYQNNKLVSGCLTIDGYKVQYQNDKFTSTKGDCNEGLLVCSDTEYIYEEKTYEKNLNATSNTCETYLKRQNFFMNYFNKESDIKKYCKGQKIIRHIPVEDYNDFINNNIVVETDNGYVVNKEACITYVPQIWCDPGDTECIADSEYYCNNEFEDDVLRDIYDDIQNEIWEIESLKLHGIINNDNSLNTTAISNTCKTVNGIFCQNAECLENELEYCNSNRFSDDIDHIINENLEEDIDFYISVGIINSNIERSCRPLQLATDCFTYIAPNNQVTITGYTCGETIKNVIVPNTISYNGRNMIITKIGDEAFFNAGITNIEIPDSVTSIGVFGVYSVDSIKIGDRIITYNTVMEQGRKAPGQVSESFKMLEINNDINIYTENENKVSINIRY